MTIADQVHSKAFGLHARVNVSRLAMGAYIEAAQKLGHTFNIHNTAAPDQRPIVEECWYERDGQRVALTEHGDYDCVTPTWRPLYEIMTFGDGSTLKFVVAAPGTQELLRNPVTHIGGGFTAHRVA